MITDPIFYRLFESSPETFFFVLGMSADSAREMAERYQYEALEFGRNDACVMSAVSLFDGRGTYSIGEDF